MPHIHLSRYKQNPQWQDYIVLCFFKPMVYVFNRKLVFDEHPKLKAPHDLSIFEDHIYYLVANSFSLNRCVLYGAKQCETYIHRVFDANTFVIKHPSVQRDDLKNICKGVVCANVCTLDEKGATCVCEDGTTANNGICLLFQKSEVSY